MTISSLCESFRSLAFATFSQLARARRLGHQMLEETLTDLNLLELKDHNPSEIYCRSFTKREEGAHGADWEWWLTNHRRTSWLGFRVQAKVLNLTKDAFPHLHYRRGLAYQTTHLKDAALREGLIPLYCFYLHHPSLAAHRPSPCGTFPHAPESYGCSLSSVSHVETLRRLKRTDLDAVLSGATPWHCLVCCSGYGGEDLPARAWAYARKALAIPAAGLRRRSMVAPPVEPGPRSLPPQYVLAAMDGLDSEELPRGVRGVLVVQERDDA